MPTINPVKAPKRSKPSKFEKHGYYRKPDRGDEANWITVKGIKHGKRERLEDHKGFTYLREYGEMPDGHTNQWEWILTHEGGPEEFPASQILTYRWYNPEDIPTRCDWEGKDEEPCPYMLKLQEGVTFPQLTGHKVEELSCPECDRPPFAVIDGVGGIGPLARHLSIMHDWDADRMTKYGKKVGIDFDLAYASERKPKTFDFGDAVRADFSCECGWGPDANKEASPSKQLRGHQLGAHKE